MSREQDERTDRGEEILSRVHNMVARGHYRQPRPLTVLDIRDWLHPRPRSEYRICREIFTVFEKSKRFPQ